MLLAQDQVLSTTGLEELCPVEFSVIMEMFCVFAVQYGNH